MRKILSLCAAMLVAFAVSAGNLIQIDNSTPDALRHALDGANDGDVIEMAAGTYVESNAGFIAFDGKDVTVKAAEGAEVILQPQVSIIMSNGGCVHFENIKIDASHIRDAEGAWYEHIIYGGDTNEDNSIILEGCELYDFALNKAFIHSSDSYRIGSISINNCYFHNNRKSCLFLEDTQMATLTITNSTFANTYLESGDAGSYYAGNIDVRSTVANILIDHCTFVDIHLMNTDFAAIGKIKVANASQAIVSNCIFAMTTAGTANDRAIRDKVTANNCLFFNYTTDGNWGTQSAVVKNAACIKEQDPLFADAANGDYTLGDGSPAIDAGDDGKSLGDPRWVKAAPALLTEPDAAPTAPTWPDNQVKAVYSDTYGADCNFGWWDSYTEYTQDTYGKKYVTTDRGYFGLEFDALNCSAMEKLNLAVWIADDASIRIVPIWGGAEQGITKALVGQQWNYIEIPLADFDQITDWTNINQIKIDNAANLTFWLNDVYFSTSVAPAVDDKAPENFTAALASASYFSAKIKASATDASGSVIFTVKNGDDVVATAVAASGVEAIINVPNLLAGDSYNFAVTAKDESGNETASIAVEATTLAAPAVAPVPDFTDKENVVSIFCDARDDNAAFNIGGWGQSTQANLVELAADEHAWYLSNMNYLGWELVAHQDASAAEFLHVDFYATDMTEVSVTPISPGHEGKYVVALGANAWTSVDIPLSAFDANNIDWSDIFQFKFFEPTPNGADLFIDNVFFFSEIPAPSALSLTDFITDKPATEVELKDLTVIFASGKNTYVIDEDGVALVIYDASKTYYDGTLEAGKVLSGQKATYTAYNNQDEIIPTNTAAVSDGIAPVPTLLVAEPTEANVNQYVRFAKVQAIKNTEDNKYYIFDGNVLLYGATGSLKPTEDGDYDMEGIIINFKGNQIELIVTAIQKSSTSAVENVEKAEATKIMRNGQMYIIRDGKMYNVVGAEVK